MQASHRADLPPFIRDRFTWTAYILLGYFAYLQGLQGPIMPFLRQELQLSYVIGSMHLSISAIGMVLIGLFGDRIVQHLGTHKSMWGGALGMTLGALGLMFGRHIALTMTSTACMGISASLLLVAQQTALAYHHKQRSAIAFTESNIAASLCAMLAPLAIGAILGASLSWRIAVLLPLPVLVLLIMREGRQPVPVPTPHAEASSPKSLPLRFWALWTVASLGVAAEWSLGFWGADYLHSVVGFPLAHAVSLLSIFFIAMLLGRIAGSRLARRYTPIHLLGAALLIAIIGVVLLWQASLPALSLSGMALAGFGIGNLFPMSLAAAVISAPKQLSAATARMTLAGGVAILSAPLLLGAWADQLGLHSAFGLVPAMLLLALLIIIAMRS